MSGVFGSGLPVTSVVNNYSSGSFSRVSNNKDCAEILSGAPGADTWMTALDVSGPGIIKAIACTTEDATPRTISLRITVDDTVVFNATSDSISTAEKGLVAFGCVDAYDYIIQTGNEVFNSSLKVEIKQSLNETDKIKAIYAYVLT